MKKFVCILCALLVLCLPLSAFATGNRQDFEELGVSFTLPSEYDVFTPDNISSSLASKHGLSASTISSMFSNGIELVALPQDNDYLFMFLSTEGESFEHIDDSMFAGEAAAEFFEEQLGNMMDGNFSNFETHRFNGKNYLSGRLQSDDQYIFMYFTVSGSRLYAFAIGSLQASVSALPADKAALMESILSSVTYSAPSSSSSGSGSGLTFPTQDEGEQDDLLISPNQQSSGLPAYVYILIGAAAVLVVVVIVLVVVLTGKQKKKQQDEVAALRQAVQDMQRKQSEKVLAGQPAASASEGASPQDAEKSSDSDDKIE